MEKDIQKLKEKLNSLLLYMPTGSKEVIKLSKEIDLLINEYYKKENSHKKVI